MINFLDFLSRIVPQLHIVSTLFKSHQHFCGFKSGEWERQQLLDGPSSLKLLLTWDYGLPSKGQWSMICQQKVPF